MIAPAYLHRDTLAPVYARASVSPRFRWFSNTSVTQHELTIEPNDWKNIQRVSLGGNGEVIGYLAAGIDRDTYRVDELAAMRFCERDDPNTVIFRADLREFMRELIRRRFESVSWSMTEGNPAERLYDAAIVALNGRVVGMRRRAVRMSTGEIVGLKLYEFLPSEVPAAFMESTL